jgi:hypothetical protein
VVHLGKVLHAEVEALIGFSTRRSSRISSTVNGRSVAATGELRGGAQELEDR